MRFVLTLASVLVCLLAVGPARGQFKEPDAEAVKVGESRTSQWRAGVVVRASGGACRKLAGYFPVPTDWPEQEVRTLHEEISPEIKLRYELVDGGAKIANIRIAQLASGAEAKALVTFEIRRSMILPPEKTDKYVLADPKKLPGDVRRYLSPSPKIESRDPRIRELAKKVGADKEKAWEKVEAIYDWVRAKVKYQNGPLKGAVAALKDGTGDCEELTSLFIAICRAADIPARTVWVPGHCYPEFYLKDDQGKGHWFPCQAAGRGSSAASPNCGPYCKRATASARPRTARNASATWRNT